MKWLMISLAIAAGVLVGVAAQTSTASSPLVGRWERINTCQQLVAELRKAGLGVTAQYAWVGQTSSTGESSFKPGSPTPTNARPCMGAIPRRHSHFFNASGQFGSLDWKGGQVDDGPYQIINSNTFQIGSPGVKFHFRILRGNTLMLSPVLTKAMVRQAVAHPKRFSPAFWAVSVAYGGYTWERAPCNRWC